MQEINDLKNIVIQSLESKGILSQLRAQIRSSVFKIIEDQESKDAKNPAFFWENPLCQKIHESTEGLIAIELMHEFFEFFRMDYTNNVFVHESNYKESFSRDTMKQKLNIRDETNEEPLLVVMIKQLAAGLASVRKTSEKSMKIENNSQVSVKSNEKSNNIIRIEPKQDTIIVDEVHDFKTRSPPKEIANDSKISKNTDQSMQPDFDISHGSDSRLANNSDFIKKQEGQIANKSNVSKVSEVKVENKSNISKGSEEKLANNSNVSKKSETKTVETSKKSVEEQRQSEKELENQ